MLAGPNGAGKSTFYENHLSDIGLPFINADLFANEHFGNQEPETAYDAARLAERIRQHHVENANSFIFETVLSDPVGAKVQFLEDAKQDRGFFVSVHFIGISSANLSQARVIQRVQKGGHDVPDEKISSRFPRTLKNLQRLLPVADELTIYDNSEVARPHRVVAYFQNGDLSSLSDDIPDWLEFLNLPSLTKPETTILNHK